MAPRRRDSENKKSERPPKRTGPKGGAPTADPALEIRTGRVVAHHGVAVIVRFDDGESKQIWLGKEQRAVVGERVRVEGPRLESLPAHGVLQRRDPRGRERTIAANLDWLFIVVAAEPREQPGYIDRGIVIARAAGIEPAIVVNKLDLPGSPPLAERLAEIYGPSCDVLSVSAVEGRGLDAIEVKLSGGQIGALVGPSGVGKSSLLNALVPDLALSVSELNRASGHGRHTTTTATLHTLAGGGLLVDTAGFKDFIAVDVSPTEAAACFPGFEVALENSCRFRNCLHQSEPDCAVLEAAAAGRIPERRLAAYSALQAELASTASSGRSRESGSSSSSDPDSRKRSR